MEPSDYDSELFSVHSDITSVLLQIDELVVQAMKHKTLSKQVAREVEPFRSVLSDMLSTLKALMSTNSVPPSKEEYLFDVESPEPTQFEPLVSPSPLVHSCGTDKGGQLFLLSPLPPGKSDFLKHQNSSKLMAKRILPTAAPNQSLQASKETSLGGELMKTAELDNSSPVLRRKFQSELLMSPCFKMSPPKCCKLLKSIPASSQDLESSPVWWFSPPKTRMLMKPGDEKKPWRMVSSLSFPNINTEAKHTKEESLSMVVESTPVLKEPTNKRTSAGESTLKKELWERFEEATIQDSHFSLTATTTTVRGNKKKGFMEMLEEVNDNSTDLTVEAIMLDSRASDLRQGRTT